MFFLGVCLTLGVRSLPLLDWSWFAILGLAILSLRVQIFRSSVFFLLGFFWACYSFQLMIDSPFPSEYERVDFVAVGSVDALPIHRNGNYEFRFTIESIELESIELSKQMSLLGKRLQLSCYRCPLEIHPGETWRLTLRVKRPRGYASWGSFDYEKYLFRHQIIAKGYIRLKGVNERISLGGSSIHRWRESLLEDLKHEIGDGIGSAIISALTIGVKTGFSKEQKAVFQITGVSHLMAISGLHVGLVFTVVMLLFKYLLWPFAKVFEYCPRQQLVLFPALVAAGIYAALAGFSVSTQRAMVMLIVYVLCKLLARDISLIKVLIIAIVILLLIDPFSILDIGFWLSCSAVAIIALASLNKSRSKERQMSLLRLQPLLWLGMLPLSVVFFGQVSVISPFVNLLAVPLFCILLIPATLASVLIFIFGFDSLGGWCLHSLSQAYQQIFQYLEMLAKLEFAKVYATPLNWWQWALFLILLSSLMRPLKTFLFLGAIFVVSVFSKPVKYLKDDELYLTLLDVGQGLSMVVETANTISVYDTGPKYGSGFTAAEAVLLPFLRQRGVDHIDTLVISHADNDHIGGLQAIRDAYNIKRVISSRPDKVSGAAECVYGQSWQYDQTVFTVLSPQADTPKGSNNRSCVIMLQHQGLKILLSGDIEKQVERFLLKQPKIDLNADILLVPHQGSKTSSTDVFLDTVSPSLAMLAAGYKNHYGHPHKNVVKRYQARDIELLSTIDAGSILLKINSQGWQKVLYREQNRRFWHY
jgi:competence protein ComEC